MQALGFAGAGRPVQLEMFPSQLPVQARCSSRLGDRRLPLGPARHGGDLGFQPPFTTDHRPSQRRARARLRWGAAHSRWVRSCSAETSVWTIVGLAGGRRDFRHGSTPYGMSMSIPYWGSRVELMEVIAIARDGGIHAETTEFPLTQGVDVYAKLKARQISCRAVLIPA